ncbi:MAG TPA: alkene reductase, partial [Gammaproteobacteria bacterium]
DLVQRFTSGAELAKADPASFYSPGPKGYVDYPALAEAAVA